MIKDPVLFAHVMSQVANVLPRNVDDEDLVSIMLTIMSMYIHEADLAEDILQYATDNVKNFYKKAKIDKKFLPIVKTSNRLH